jgi:hypothetical protein
MCSRLYIFLLAMLHCSNSKSFKILLIMFDPFDILIFDMALRQNIFLLLFLSFITR